MIKELEGAFVVLDRKYHIFDIEGGSRLSDKRFKEFVLHKRENEVRRSNKRKAKVKSNLHIVMYFFISVTIT
jgi:hypothetical protein